MAAVFPRRCWAEVDLSALEENVRLIRRQLPPKTFYISVVKADGYGLGATRILPALRAGGADAFAVANIAEGAELRAHDFKTPILLLSATFPEEEEAVFEYNLTPTLSCPEEIRRYNALARRFGRKLPVHLKVDTGMGRLGIWHCSAQPLLKAAANASFLEIRGIYSHFASAGSDPKFTRLQRERFSQILDRIGAEKPPLIHIDNSAGLPSFDRSGRFNAVRVGLLQYGIRANPEPEANAFAVSPVLSLHARVSLTKTLPNGATVSYGRTRTLTRDSKIAVVAAGYADGIFRACSNRGQVLIRGRRCPIVGQVTMDNFMIDVTNLPDAAPGDRVTIIGHQENEEISILEYSACCGTIPWESLCAIGKRVRREAGVGCQGSRAQPDTHQHGEV